MGTGQLCLIGAVMLSGLLGVLVPGAPGPLMCWAAVLWWATHLHTSSSWGILAVATGVLLLNQAVQLLLPARSVREAGVPRQAFLVAGLWAVAGFFLLPVVGAPAGFTLALYGGERMRLGSHGAAWSSTRTAMRAAGTALLAELFACLLVAGAWLVAVLTS
ncbi:DUF456 domain-containing protein [Actinacidiphila glaucinigra]|uniref:DUF456 domain-containing protein n=1 Tax=Actinacidiphila glaucinigra TaxID=235986 RepID=UPI0036E67B99